MKLDFRKQYSRPTIEDISVFETRWKIVLPPQFKAFALENGGGTPADCNCFYPVPAKYKEFRFEYGVISGRPPGFHISSFLTIAQAPSGMSLNSTMSILTNVDRLPIDRIPVASDGIGNYILVSVRPSPPDKIFFYDREFTEQFDVAETFDEFILGLGFAPPDP